MNETMINNNLVTNANGANVICIGQSGNGMSFYSKIKRLYSHNWRKMHGLPIKTPRLINLCLGCPYKTRSKRKQAHYRAKSIFVPADMEIENPRIRTVIKRYRYEPKKFRRKIKRILLSEQRHS